MVLIDDLSTGLDAISKRIVWNALRDMKKGRSIIVTSQDPLEATMIADRVGILEEGFLKANGSPVFLKSRQDQPARSYLSVQIRNRIYPETGRYRTIRRYTGKNMELHIS